MDRFLGALLLASACMALGAPWALPAAAAPVVELGRERQPQRLLQGGEAWLDPTGTASIEQVASGDGRQWQPLSETAIYPLARGKALWVRFTLRTEANPVGERWYIEVPYPAVDRVTLFSLAPATGRWTAASSGDLLPVADWPVPHRHPLLPLATRSGGTRTVYLRVENSHSFSAPLQFITESHQSLSEQRMSLVLGFYLGLVALTMTLAVLSAVTLRDRAFALYAVTVAAMGLTLAAMTGIAGMHLWPDWPWWNDVSHFVFPVLAAGCMSAFVATVASLRERSQLVHKLVVGLALLALPLTLAILLVDPALRNTLMLTYVGALIPLLLLVLAWAMSRGDRYAGWVLLASMPVGICAALPLARSAGWMAASFWTQHSMQLALAIELPVLLIMLMHRSQQRRDYSRRMHGLDRFDPATGLINGSVFRERLVRLIARSVRFKFRSAILVVDIVNLDQIRREFDRRAAEELPLRVAGRLVSAAREIDSVARLAENRFGLLLEGPLKASEVAEAAPRIVARCLMPFKDRPLNWAPQVRVAQGLIPKDGTDPDHLIAQLDGLLAAAAPDGKRAVFLVSKPNLPTPMPLTPSTF